MKIVDLRPMVVRRFTRNDQRPSTPGIFGRLAGWFSDELIRKRVARRPRAQGSALLISVGNLALGGTGKTPVVMALARDLAAAGLKGAVLTRGYGSPLAGPFLVEPDNLLAGDEARMMAHRLSDFSWPVVQSKNRPEGQKFLAKLSCDFQVVLLEDAFQTGGLARHVDLLILDSWLIEETGAETRLVPITGSVFPFGPWRETFRGADRATALLVEGKADLPGISQKGQPVFSFSRFVELSHVHGSDVEADVGSWALVSGIARPEKFEASAMNLLGEPVVLVLRCRDHANYTKKLQETILKAMDETGAEGLVTTAKDWVKLSNVWNDPRPVLVLNMELIWGNKDAFNQWLVECVKNQGSDQSSATAP